MYIPFRQVRRNADILTDRDLIYSFQIVMGILRNFDRRSGSLSNGIRHLWEDNLGWLRNQGSCFFAEIGNRGMFQPRYAGNLHLLNGVENRYRIPDWWGRTEIHQRHKHLLCRRNWEHYGGMFPDVFMDDAACLNALNLWDFGLHETTDPVEAVDNPSLEEILDIARAKIAERAKADNF